MTRVALFVLSLALLAAPPRADAQVRITWLWHRERPIYRLAPNASGLALRDRLGLDAVEGLGGRAPGLRPR